MILKTIQTAAKQKKKLLGVLIDPDKFDTALLPVLKKYVPDFILVGGSLLSKDIDGVILQIKKAIHSPVIIFPGNAMQISDNADGILFLSLISGRNPEFLIGQQVLAAPLLHQTTLEVIPTGYILVENGKTTAVEYMSNTHPIPPDKTDILIATALAGQYLGHRLMYLEAGSGAQTTARTESIKALKKVLNVPLLVGGGIGDANQLEQIYSAGADMAILGTVLEQKPEHLEQFIAVRNHYNG